MNEMTNDAAVAEIGRFAITAHGAGEWYAHEHKYGTFVFYSDHATTVAELRAEIARLKHCVGINQVAVLERDQRLDAAIADGRKLAEALDRVVGWCNGVMNHPNISFNPELYEAAKKVKALTKESP